MIIQVKATEWRRCRHRAVGQVSGTCVAAWRDGALAWDRGGARRLPACLSSGGRWTGGDVTITERFLGAVIDERSYALMSPPSNVPGAAGVSVLAGGRYGDTAGCAIATDSHPGRGPVRQDVHDRVLPARSALHVYRIAVSPRSWAPWSPIAPCAPDRVDHRQDPDRDRQRPSPALRRQQLLCQRQTDRGGRGPTLPFGGARASGTNDKAGSILNLLHWTSPPARSKETLLPGHRAPIPTWAEHARSGRRR